MDELFRRMVFNMVIDNCDDHIKNHGVLHVEARPLPPVTAFDLVPQRLNLGHQQLAILPGRFDAHLDLAREAAPHFGLAKVELIASLPASLARCATTGSRR